MKAPKILLGFVLAAIVALVVNSQADMWQISERAVKWRTDVNTSADTGQVWTTVADTTAWLALTSEEATPSGGYLGGGIRKVYMPDSIFVSFKATADGVETDSLDAIVTLQVSDDQTTVSSTKTVATLAEAITVSTSEVMGFAWGPGTIFDEGTPAARYYRYIFTGQAVSGDDSIDVSDMRERIYSVNR